MGVFLNVHLGDRLARVFNGNQLRVYKNGKATSTDMQHGDISHGVRKRYAPMWLPNMNHVITCKEMSGAEYWPWRKSRH